MLCKDVLDPPSASASFEVGWTANPKGGERIGADFESSPVNPGEEFPENPAARLFGFGPDLVQSYGPLPLLRLIVEYNLHHFVVFHYLSKHRAAGHSTLLMFIPPTQLDDDFWAVVDDVE